MFYTPVALKQAYITYVHCQFLKSKHMNYIRNQQSPDNREQKKNLAIIYVIEEKVITDRGYLTVLKDFKMAVL